MKQNTKSFEKSEGSLCESSRQQTLAILGTLATAALVARFGLIGPVEVDDRRLGVPLVIDVNRAPAGVLEALPRIGPTLARRIVEARDEAPIVDSTDLDARVRGIGPATIEAMRPHLRFRD